MTTAYFDCFSGISGDMLLGAFIDLGLDPVTLRRQLAAIPIEGYEIVVRREKRQSISGVSFTIKIEPGIVERSLQDILFLIGSSSLPACVIKLSGDIFTNLARAEARVHACNIEDVHFHEIGCVDSILDIVGTAIALNELSIDRIISSPVPTGYGSVVTSHGTMPVPAPATLELLKGIPLAESSIKSELTTPTGAAILKTIAVDFGIMPSMIVESSGYGIGSRELGEQANLLRIITGRVETYVVEVLTVLETSIDDMDPQIYEYLVSKLLKAGALDAFIVPIQMKKGRPGVELKVLSPCNKRKELTDIIFSETTTLGVRSYMVNRSSLEREEVLSSSIYGDIRIKVSKQGGKVTTVKPSYDDCRKIAEQSGIPLRNIIREAGNAFRIKQEKG